jgi:hypothetical protein
MRRQRCRFTGTQNAFSSRSRVGQLVKVTVLRGLKRPRHYPHPGDRLWRSQPSQGLTGDGRHLGQRIGSGPSRGRARCSPNGMSDEPSLLPNEALIPLRYGRLGKAPVTVPGCDRDASTRRATSLRQEVSEPSGAGQSSRRERSQREMSGQRRRIAETRSLARDVSVGRARNASERYASTPGHPRKELRRRATAGAVRGVRIVHGRARGVIRLQKSTSGARPCRCSPGCSSVKDRQV